MGHDKAEQLSPGAGFPDIATKVGTKKKYLVSPKKNPRSAGTVNQKKTEMPQNSESAVKAAQFEITGPWNESYFSI